MSKKRTKLVFAANVSEAIFPFATQEQCTDFLKQLSKAVVKLQKKLLKIPKETTVELKGISGAVLAVPEGQDFNDLEADVMLFAEFGDEANDDEESEDETDDSTDEEEEETEVAGKSDDSNTGSAAEEDEADKTSDDDDEESSGTEEPEKPKRNRSKKG